MQCNSCSGLDLSGMAVAFGKRALYSKCPELLSLIPLQHIPKPVSHRHRVGSAAARWERKAVQAEPDSVVKESRDVPWTFGFQMNERYLIWDDSAARQLIRMTLSEKLNISMEEVDQRLEELGVLVPDMVGKLARMRYDVLLPLLQDLPATTRMLLGMKDLLPGVNISLFVSRWPYVLLNYDLASLESRLTEMRQLLPGVRVEALVDAEPMMLKADISKVLDNIRRLMPSADPVAILVTQPQMVLDMVQAGMSSAMDVEGYPSQQQAP